MMIRQTIAGKTWAVIIAVCVVQVLVVGAGRVGATESEQAPIRIAAIFALSGPAAASNRSSISGTQRAVEEINRSGGVLGRPLQLLLLDNKSTPIGSHIAAERAVLSAAVAIVGAMWSSHSIAVARVAQENGIPMVSNASTHPQLTRIGDFIFRVCFTDELQGAAMARFAYDRLEARTAALLVNVSSDYSIGLSRIFGRHFVRLGGRILDRVEYKPNQETFAPQISKVADADADVMFLSGHEESITFAVQARRAGVRAIALGGDGWTTQFYGETRPDLPIGYFSTHWTKDLENNRSLNFVRHAKRPWDLHVGAALAYDATMLVADALRRAGGIDRRGLRDALAATRDYQGVTGTITFDDQGDPLKQAVILKVQNGDLVLLDVVEPSR